VFYTAATALFIALHANESVYLYNIVERKKKNIPSWGRSVKQAINTKKYNSETHASQLI